MSFTIGTATFTNGSNSVTNVSLTSGKLSYFSSGTRMVVGTNPVVAEVEAIDAPAVNAITLREPWAFATGTYAFLANMTSEGIRDAAQTLRTYVDGLSVAPTAGSTAVRTATGAGRFADGVNADESVVLGQLPDAPSDLYARANILGTVSQSGGVPTGAIIERGSNANGEYVKFADGTMICTKIVQSSTTITSAFADMFISPSISLGSWASSFASGSNVQVSVDAIRDGDNSPFWTGRGTPQITTTFAGALWAIDVVSRGTARLFSFYVIAIGRWY